jgi:hypothetical protein
VTTDQTGYLTELHMLVTATGPLMLVAEAIDIARLRQLCGQMETVAPFLEPTAYMRGGMTNLADQAAFLRAVEEFVAAVRKLDRRTPEEASRG